MGKLSCAAMTKYTIKVRLTRFTNLKNLFPLVDFMWMTLNSLSQQHFLPQMVFNYQFTEMGFFSRENRGP